MERIESVHQMQSLAISLRLRGRLIALVPTQGALHAGHASLIAAARKQADTVVVSIFVNPAQFGPNEDAAAYPRDLEGDLALCAEAGADVVFVPPTEEMYPRGYSTWVTEENLSKGLCGISRPSHFRGVTTVTTKLCNIVRPDLLVFGQKNAQQAAVVRRMLEDLNFSIQTLVEPTVRDEAGLALGSRNLNLTQGQRDDMAIIHRALATGKALVDGGNRNVDRVVAETTHTLAERRRVRVIYVSIVDRETMEPERTITPGRSLLMVAVWIDEVRFIDNIVL
ncbi:pantoate--beta-alanine ligase [Opitutales bacterium ASA1]|uniref:pantoate--beta-alanine ligase n=1 Tax=Congregicoccus parvus TaxID=3081749 RepID=UPI002B31A25B|nr:pantoate--beta-alanine ligase [Opitutales bacterium ASA1]